MVKNINTARLTTEYFLGAKEIEIAQRGKEKIKLFKPSRKLTRILRGKRFRANIAKLIKSVPLINFRRVKMIDSQDIIIKPHKDAFLEANSSPFDSNIYYEEHYEFANPRASDAERTFDLLKTAGIDWINDGPLFAKLSQKFSFDSLTSKQRLALKPLLNKELNTLAMEICKSEDYRDDVEIIESSAVLESLVKPIESALMEKVSIELSDRISEYFDEEKVNELIDCAKKENVNESYGNLTFDFIDKQGKRQVKTFDDAEIDDLIAQKPGPKSENSVDDIDKWM